MLLIELHAQHLLLYKFEVQFGSVLLGVTWQPPHGIIQMKGIPTAVLGYNKG